MRGYTLALTIALALGLSGCMSKQENYQHLGARQFDPEMWRSHVEDRPAMLENLISEHHLIGMKRQDVAQLLGKFDIYYSGSTSRAYRLSQSELCVLGLWMDNSSLTVTQAEVWPRGCAG
ncbi:hypothetical protein ACKC9G_14805 [Pokkaliibacter sp. CJK22405]|uniref:hypothetical protein n=1 Tax=Pokkaliibacter sp. CJK22405 TaxID=3384615 RepID=UPI003984A88C